MKRKVILIISIISILLCYCTKQNSDNLNMDGLDMDNFVKNPIDVSGETGVLLEWDATYTYQENNVVLLWLQNNDDKAYSVKVTGIFSDEAGEELKKITKNFEGLSKGCCNCFIFDPRCEYSNFSYKIEADEYNGKTWLEFFCPEKKATVDFMPNFADQMNNEEKIRLVKNIFYNVQNNSDVQLNYGMEIVIFNNKGEIDTIHSQEGIFSPGINNNGVAIIVKNEFWNEEYTTPEELKGNLNVIFSIFKLYG
jgi:hypothetical protein